MLEVKDICHNIGSKKILNQITLSFAPGRFHVILGPNGSGKSTFLKVFSGEQKPATGKIFYDDKDISSFNKTVLAQRRSVMSQSADIQFPLSAGEIVMMGRYPHFNYQPSANDHLICNEVIHQMQIAEFLDRDFLTLSGGEKQRVQFGRALAQIWEVPAAGSRYLFLDEPINNLDIHYQHQFLQLAKNFTTDRTVTIAILHDINLAIEYADTITFLKSGQVVSHGKPKDTITSTLIDDVFNIPVGIIEHPATKNPLIVYNGFGNS